MMIMREFLLAWALGSSTLLLLWLPTVLRMREFPRGMMVLLHKIIPPHPSASVFHARLWGVIHPPTKQNARQ